MCRVAVPPQDEGRLRGLTPPVLWRTFVAQCCGGLSLIKRLEGRPPVHRRLPQCPELTLWQSIYYKGRGMKEREETSTAMRQYHEQMLKLVAKGFYNELINYGVNETEVLTVAGHLLDNVMH